MYRTCSHEKVLISIWEPFNGWGPLECMSIIGVRGMGRSMHGLRMPKVKIIESLNIGILRPQISTMINEKMASEWPNPTVTVGRVSNWDFWPDVVVSVRAIDLIIGLFMGAHKLVLTVCQEYNNNKFSYAHAHGNYVTLIIIIKFPPTHRHMHTRAHMHPYPCGRTHANMQINSYELGPDMNSSNPT